MERDIQNADALLKRLVEYGGAVVSSGECTEMEIADARARGDFYVDDKGLGYVRRLQIWLDKAHLALPSGAPNKTDQ